MQLALVTGPRPHLGATAATLARTGFNVMTWEAATPLPRPDGNRRSFSEILRKSNAGSGLEGPFDCYVQLPCGEIPAGRPAPVGLQSGAGAAGRRAADELVWRIDMLAAVGGRLAPTASVLLGVEDIDPSADLPPGTLAPDLLAAVALAVLEDLGRPAVRVAVLSVGDLCRPAPVFARIDPVVGATQWEIPTPPLVSAP